MFDIAAPGQPALATVQVGQESRGLAVSPDGKYVMAGNYNPGGAVLCDAHTLKPLKVYDTSRVINTEGQIEPSRVAYIADTPYGPYFSFGLKDAISVVAAAILKKFFIFISFKVYFNRISRLILDIYFGAKAPPLSISILFIL